MRSLCCCINPCCTCLWITNQLVVCPSKPAVRQVSRIKELHCDKSSATTVMIKNTSNKISVGESAWHPFPLGNVTWITACKTGSCPYTHCASCISTYLRSHLPPNEKDKEEVNNVQIFLKEALGGLNGNKRLLKIQRKSQSA